MDFRKGFQRDFPIFIESGCQSFQKVFKARKLIESPPCRYAKNESVVFLQVALPAAADRLAVRPAVADLRDVGHDQRARHVREERRDEHALQQEAVMSTRCSRKRAALSAVSSLGGLYKVTHPVADLVGLTFIWGAPPTDALGMPIVVVGNFFLFVYFSISLFSALLILSLYLSKQAANPNGQQYRGV